MSIYRQLEVNAFSDAPRPRVFLKSSAYPEDSEDEESTVGKMPSSDSEDD